MKGEIFPRPIRGSIIKLCTQQPLPPIHHPPPSLPPPSPPFFCCRRRRAFSGSLSPYFSLLRHFSWALPRPFSLSLSSSHFIYNADKCHFHCAPCLIRMRKESAKERERGGWRCLCFCRPESPFSNTKDVSHYDGGDEFPFNLICNILKYLPAVPSSTPAPMEVRKYFASNFIRSLPNIQHWSQNQFC